MLKDHLEDVKRRIASVCRRIGRDPAEVILVGATKYSEASQIQEALQAGLKHIGENRVQDAQRKFSELERLGVKAVRHMIGHLQTNKVKDAVRFFDLIQSVDSVKLALEIEKQSGKLNQTIDILVEVNTSGEEQKFGVRPQEITPLIEEISRCPHIRLLGLMTMAPFIEDQAVIRRCFRSLRELFDAVSKQFAASSNIQMKYLSMGMTSDYEIALEEGSNMVRIGRAIFK